VSVPRTDAINDRRGRKSRVTTPIRRSPTRALAPQNTAEQERWRDNEHLRLLSICHFAIGGLAVVMLPFFGMYFVFIYSFLKSVPFITPSHNGPPPEAFDFMFVVYPIVGLLTAAGAVLHLLSGWFLLKKRYRVFSLVVAGLDCLYVPLGTLLGVFTILVLTRPSVGRMYEERLTSK
jgi:hypothetical protein